MRVLVTGSTAGIGRHTAETLIRQGHEVVVHARNEGRSLPAMATCAPCMDRTLPISRPKPLVDPVTNAISPASGEAGLGSGSVSRAVDESSLRFMNV